MTALLVALVAAPLPAADLQESAPPTVEALAVGSESSGSGASGVDIRIADLMADGSELAGVAPRPATSGIGADLERDLFATDLLLNALTSPPPENNPLPPY